MFESEDEKKARVKSILQLLILREAIDNVGTEEYFEVNKAEKNSDKIKKTLTKVPPKNF
jgi:hypothetical protein